MLLSMSSSSTNWPDLCASTLEWLRSFPNVTDVGFGQKMRYGKFLEEQTLVVYVSRKYPENELPTDAILPKQVDGVPVDVQEDLDSAYFRISQGDGLDLTRKRPLQSGIAISTASASDHGGTLGGFAFRNADKKKVLVSNYHVLFRNRGLPGLDEEPNKVYQPTHADDNLVATVPDGSGKIGGAVDCAYALLAEEGSCFCCKHIIPHENKVGNTILVGVATAQQGQKVFKQGAKTGPTVGKVVNTSKSINGAVSYADYSLPAGDSFTFSNLIMIVFWDEANNDFDPTRSFAEAGDSGSMVYNEANQIVGLHFGSHFNPNTGRHYSMACHIELVENELGITIPGTRNYGAGGGVPPSPELASLDNPMDSENVSFAGSTLEDNHILSSWWQQAYPQLVRSQGGKDFLEIAEAHVFEIMHLVNKNREVTLTWHRNHGPSFIAAMGRSVKLASYRIPEVIDGVSREQLFTNMCQVISKYASPPLKLAIDQYALSLLYWLQHYNTVSEWMHVLETNRWVELANALEIMS